MAETPLLTLPLLASAQSQKHVTVNEALTRLDGLVLLAVASRAVATPPTSPASGDRYIVAAGATGDWAGAEGALALYVNGGWDLIQPQLGWRAFAADEAAVLAYDGGDWVLVDGALSTIGAATASEIAWTEHSIAAGATSDTAALIPDRAVVLGVTARVTSAIGGATSWRLGVVGGEDRYGSGLGVALNSEAHGVSGTPLAYYGDTSLRLTADGGDFTGGAVRIAVHFLSLTPPRMV